jgi:hypothetical protein
MVDRFDIERPSIPANFYQASRWIHVFRCELHANFAADLLGGRWEEIHWLIEEP